MAAKTLVVDIAAWESKQNGRDVLRRAALVGLGFRNVGDQIIRKPKLSTSKSLLYTWTLWCLVRAQHANNGEARGM